MRVATYTDGSVPSGSWFALSILVLTILLGTGVLPVFAAFAGGVFPQLITPLWLSLYLAALLGLMFQHGINWISWLVRYRILFVILMIGTIISVSWSIAPQVSAERVVHLVGSSLIAVYIGFTIPLLVTLRIFAVVLAVILISSIAAALGLPAMGIEAYEGTQVWRGVFNSKNDLGFWAGAGVLLYVTLSDSYHSMGAKTLCFLMAVVCLGVLAFSQSATSLVAMVIAGSLSLYLYIATRFQLGFIRMSFMAVLFISLASLAIANINTSELVGRSGDLTGRGEVWRQVLDLISQYPLTGVGYGSLWFPTDDTIWVQQSFFDFSWTVYHAHNGLLQIASEIGTPLALIALLMVAQQLIEIFYCQYERQQVGVLFVLGFVVAFLISNFSEARFLVSRELFWIFFVALPISMLRQINVVSAETSITGDQPSTDHSLPAGDVSYAGVPGKPWLGQVPQRTARIPAYATAGAATAGLIGHTAGYAGVSDEELDLSMGTLSLTETDIDLGGVVDHDEDVDDKTGRGNTNDETQEYLPRESADLLDSTSEPDLFEHNGTFEIDRYDIIMGLDDDWVDIELADDR